MTYFHEARAALVRQTKAARDVGVVKFGKQALDLMGQAVRYHVPDLWSVITATRGDTYDGGLFKGEMAVGWKTPYPVIWLDATHRLDGVKEKLGVLSTFYEDEEEEGEFLGMEVIAFHHHRGVWLPAPVVTQYQVRESGVEARTKGFGPRIDVDAYIDNTMYHYSSLNMFLKLLTCKNISAVDNYPSKSKQKKMRRKGLPLLSYKTLVVTPTKAQQKEVGFSNGDTNRLHLCAGHFKYYTKEKPLFGKFTGTYWWQPMIRGSKKKGLVVKDYEVKA